MSIRAVNVMYEQQLQHLPKEIKRKTLNSIFKVLEKRLKPVKMAGIIHDKDMNEQGEPVTEHVHIVLQFENSRSLAQLAKQLNEPQVSAFQQWKGNVNNAYSYLVHQTNEAQGKYQYPVEEVKATFDYVALMKDITKKVKGKGVSKENEFIKNLLDRLGAGDLSKEDVISSLTGSQFAKAKRQINDVYQQVQAEKAKVWLSERKANNERTTVIWLYGESATGKTVLARKYAVAEEKTYYITGSSKDSFQHYEGESIVILDELRPTTFHYDDLLKMLDPYGENPKAPSRYFDKSLMVDLFIVTSPYSPKQFYDELFKKKKTIDSFKQLQRRITFVQWLTPDFIAMQEYDEWRRCYLSLPETRQNNNLLEQLKAEQAINGRTLYHQFNKRIHQFEKENPNDYKKEKATING